MSPVRGSAAGGELRSGTEAELLRVFLGEDDRAHGRPAFQVVVEAAQHAGLAGATVLRGSLGFGADSVLHRANAFRLSGDLPVVVEIVDVPERIAAFLPQLEGLLLGGGLVTLERVRVLHARPGGGDPGGAGPGGGDPGGGDPGGAGAGGGDPGGAGPGGSGPGVAGSGPVRSRPRGEAGAP